MKKTTISALICLTLSLVLLLSSCASSDGKSPGGTHLPEYEKLTATIGLNKSDALNQLNLQEANLTEYVPYYYDLPMQVEYGGVKLTPAIEFLYGSEMYLNGINYRAEYYQNAEQAAKDMVAVAQELKKLLGAPDSTTGSGIISDLTESELLETITERKSLGKTNYWDITDSAPENVKNHMETIRNSSLWDSYGEKDPKYYLVLELSHIEESDTSYIQIRYVVRPEKAKDLNQ